MHNYNGTYIDGNGSSNGSSIKHSYQQHWSAPTTQQAICAIFVVVLLVVVVAAIGVVFGIAVSTTAGICLHSSGCEFRVYGTSCRLVRTTSFYFFVT